MTSYLPNEYTSSKYGTEKHPDNINPYLAALIITILGSLMTLLIVQVIYSNKVIIIHANDTVIYTYLPLSFPIK